jgi:hypothetical protein
MTGTTHDEGVNADEVVGLVYRQLASRFHESGSSAHVRLAGKQFRVKLGVGVGLVPHHAFVDGKPHDPVSRSICGEHILNVKVCAPKGRRGVGKLCTNVFETYEDRQAFEER